MTRKTRRPCRKRLQTRLPLSHATVLFGFPLQVSDRLRGLLLSTPPFSERNLNKRLCGAPGGGIYRQPAEPGGSLFGCRRVIPTSIAADYLHFWMAA